MEVRRKGLLTDLTETKKEFFNKLDSIMKSESSDADKVEAMRCAEEDYYCAIGRYELAEKARKDRLWYHRLLENVKASQDSGHVLHLTQKDIR